jgi:hypothetical protein
MNLELYSLICLRTALIIFFVHFNKTAHLLNQNMSTKFNRQKNTFTKQIAYCLERKMT